MKAIHVNNTESFKYSLFLSKTMTLINQSTLFATVCPYTYNNHLTYINLSISSLLNFTLIIFLYDITELKNQYLLQDYQ